MNPSLQEMFTTVPPTYQILNQLLTLGQDSIWRKRAARLAASRGGRRWLDACGGTGEMAVELSRQAKDDPRIFVADFSLPMMTKAMEKPETKRIIFTLADMKCLPFQSDTFDVITISFATRNLSISQDNLLECLGEFQRVLKPGGLFVNLETSQPRLAPMRWLFHLYVKATVPPIGRWISHSEKAYSYLSHSIRHFYRPEELAEIIRQTGFRQVSFNRMLFSAAAIHKAIK